MKLKLIIGCLALTLTGAGCAVFPHPQSCARLCVNNLRMIDSAKRQTAMCENWESRLSCDTPANVAKVNDWIKGRKTPLCPQGGKYTYGAVGEPPTCSLGASHPGHKIPVAELNREHP